MYTIVIPFYSPFAVYVYFFDPSTLFSYTVICGPKHDNFRGIYDPVDVINLGGVAYSMGSPPFSYNYPRSMIGTVSERLYGCP